MRNVGKGVIVIAVIYWLLAVWPVSGPKHPHGGVGGGSGTLVTGTEAPRPASQRKRVDWVR